MKPSLQSKVFKWVLILTNFKKVVEILAQKQKVRLKKDFLPQKIKRSYTSSLMTYSNKKIATFESKDIVTRNHIIFFHGGAYLFEALSSHWRLAKKIVKKSSCRMTLVDYPLAPEHNYKDTFKMVSGAYEMLITQYPEDNFILMGDSAGGGLALAFTQKLIIENQKKLPFKIVLLSPWLDMSMSNEAIKNLENVDCILSLKMLEYAAGKYSAGDSLHQYLLSPINGEINNLPKTIIFYGTEELFYPDCIKLKSMISSSDQDYIFKEYEKMQHDWGIFPIPERHILVEEICEFIKQ